ncbi:hypothetical protein H6P81_013790 [Aristolochia fimbriata]|uniref:RING-type domain-containing protein n=1 Tax=Aristolochia fimbriata TaxID=158543 RepID=A0AAV7EIY9_ARIFI|nr:hypothetical protein H6P81_013790 [Aristolochia fimbriata]
MAPSSLDISIIDSTSDFLAALDIIERQNGTKSMESMEIDQIMEVPDTPDRLASRRSTTPCDGNRSKAIINNGLIGKVNGTQRVNSSCRSKEKWYPNPLSSIQIVNEARSGSFFKDGHKIEEKDQRGPIVMGDSILKEVDKQLSQCQSSSSHGSPDATEIFGLNDKNKVKEESGGKRSDANKKSTCSNNLTTKSTVNGKRMLLGNGSSSSGKNVLDDVYNFKSQFESRKTEKGCSLGMATNHVPVASSLRSGLIDAFQTESCSKTQAANATSIPATAAPSVKIPIASIKKEVLPLQDGVGAGEKHLDPNRGSLHKDKGKGVSPCPGPQSKSGQESLLLQSHAPPRRTGQRRLVRNGCISPYNIAKATSSSQEKGKIAANDEWEEDGPATGDRPLDGSNRCFMGICADREKGKGVMINAVPTNHHKTRPRSFARRDLSVIDEDDIFKCAEDLGGWQCTRNRSKKTSLPASKETKSIKGRSSSLGVNEGGTHGAIEFPRINNEVPVILDHSTASNCLAQPSSSTLSVSDLERESNIGDRKLMKRAKKSSYLQNPFAECSGSTVDDPDYSFLQRSERSSNVLPSRSCNPQSRRRVSIIDVDKLSTPQGQTNNFDGIDDMVNDTSIARTRQVEADEEIARQLQEQFYNEMPEVGEIDARIAWTLQHEEDSHVASVGSQYQHLRDLSMAHLYQHGPRSVRNSSARSANRGRPTSTRMAQLRRRFSGHPRPTSAGDRDFSFPSSMGLEARIQLLEALEAVDNAMPLTGRLFQVNRDFNEDDYEMLLALDENNHQHSGASASQINSLPESKVQSFNFEEACTICLETPVTGDTIRHLPCLHKFHKKCIDPWLQRKKSCPICKSDIS